jgi:hypothetical protein
MRRKPVSNQELDEFILANLPATFMSLHLRAANHFGVDTYRKVDARLQALRKRGLIGFERVKGKGVVWSKAA